MVVYKAILLSYHVPENNEYHLCYENNPNITKTVESLSPASVLSKADSGAKLLQVIHSAREIIQNGLRKAQNGGYSPGKGWVGRPGCQNLQIYLYHFAEKGEQFST